MKNRLHKQYFFVLVLACVVCGLRPAYAAEGWETNITVSSGVAENRLSIGQRADATDDYDGKYEAMAMLGGDIRASFDSSSGALWRDIKSLEGQKSWSVKVESSLQGSEVSLKWNAVSFPAGHSMRLVDGTTGTSVNMAATSLYTYRNSGPRNLVIETEGSTSVRTTGSEEEVTIDTPDTSTARVGEGSTVRNATQIFIMDKNVLIKR